MARRKQDLTKITTNINTNVLAVLDKFARDNNVTRTTAMTLLLTRQLVALGYGSEGREGDEVGG